MSSNISAKPIAALIQKIDPTKPFGKIKLTVGVKHIRSGANNHTGSMGGIQTYGNSLSYGVSGGYTGMDPTNTQAYRDVVSNIRSGNIGDSKRSTGFFVSSGNNTSEKSLQQKILEDIEGKQENTSGGEPVIANIGRRGGVNLGQIPPLPDICEDGNVEDFNVDGNDSMGFGYNSDQANGSDLEDDLQKQ